MPATNAQAATASSTQSGKRKMDAREQKYYAVRAGFNPGVYTSWTHCQQQITGFKGAVFKSFLNYEDALSFASGGDPPSAANDGKPKPPRFYGVAVGRKPGVYTDWSQAQEAIVGWKGPKYKKFNTQEEAEAFVRSFSGGAQPATTSDDEADGEQVDGSEEPPTKKPKKTTKPTNSRNGLAVVYTDGSSLGNGRAGAVGGVGVYFGESDPRNISERLEGEVQTNQRAELTAILRALEAIDTSQDLEIRTDSKYSIQCITEWYINWERNGWKTRGGPVKNQDLVQSIRDKLAERESKGGRTQFVWVKGHDVDVGNIAADLLAVEGAKKGY